MEVKTISDAYMILKYQHQTNGDNAEITFWDDIITVDIFSHTGHVTEYSIPYTSEMLEWFKRNVGSE